MEEEQQDITAEAVEVGVVLVAQVARVAIAAASTTRAAETAPEEVPVLPATTTVAADIPVESAGLEPMAAAVATTAVTVGQAAVLAAAVVAVQAAMAAAVLAVAAAVGRAIPTQAVAAAVVEDHLIAEATAGAGVAVVVDMQEGQAAGAAMVTMAPGVAVVGVVPPTVSMDTRGLVRTVAPVDR